MRRQRERAAPVTDDGELRYPAQPGSSSHERSERYERLRQGAEALGRLKPQEVRALLLKAEGYSYREICAITGWTYTKVNRCLTEGRRAFAARLAGIEGGSECERLLPLVSALADGEACADDLRELRPHLRTCLACRARLREFRATPKRVAALLPPIAAAAQGDPAGPVRWLDVRVAQLKGPRSASAPTPPPSSRPDRRSRPSPPRPLRWRAAEPGSRRSPWPSPPAGRIAQARRGAPRARRHPPRSYPTTGATASARRERRPAAAWCPPPQPRHRNRRRHAHPRRIRAASSLPWAPAPAPAAPPPSRGGPPERRRRRVRGAGSGGADRAGRDSLDGTPAWEGAARNTRAGRGC